MDKDHRAFGIEARLTPAQATYRALVKMGYGPEHQIVFSASSAVQAEAARLTNGIDISSRDYSSGVLSTLHSWRQGRGLQIMIRQLLGR